VIDENSHSAQGSSLYYYKSITKKSYRKWIVIWIRFSRTPTRERLIRAICYILRKLRHQNFGEEAVFLNLYVAIGSSNSTASSITTSFAGYPSGAQLQLDLSLFVQPSDTVTILCNDCDSFVTNFACILNYGNGFDVWLQQIVTFKFLRISHYDPNTASASLFDLCQSISE